MYGMVASGDERPTVYFDGDTADRFLDLDIGESVDVKLKLEKISYTKSEGEKGKVETRCTLRIVAIDGDKLKKSNHIEDTLKKVARKTNNGKDDYTD